MATAILILFIPVYFSTPLRLFFYNHNGKIIHRIHNTKIDRNHSKKKLICIFTFIILASIFTVISSQPSSKTAIYTQVGYFISFFIKLTSYLAPGSAVSVQSLPSFFVNTKTFTIESPNARILFIIAMLLHALFVYIFILFSIYTIFMSTNTVMFTYLTIAYEIISEIFWWFIDNYILAPCPFLEDSDDDLFNLLSLFNDPSHEEQKLIEACSSVQINAKAR